MNVEVDLKEVITVIIELTVEHYVDEYLTDDRFQPSRKVREIKNSCIDSMKKDLIDKILDVLKQK